MLLFLKFYARGWRFYQVVPPPIVCRDPSGFASLFIMPLADGFLHERFPGETDYVAKFSFSMKKMLRMIFDHSVGWVANGSLSVHLLSNCACRGALP